MNLWQDGLIAMLAAIGLTALIWLLACAVLRCGYRSGMSAYLVIPAEGAAPELQQTVQEMENLCAQMPIVIWDCGLTEDARAVAELLCSKRENVTLLRRGEINSE